MTTLTLSVENDSNALLYVMDETALRTESDIRRSWSPVGESPILESNNSHEGVNIVGATEITKKFETVCDVYPAEQPITGLEIEEFIKYLLNHNPGKKIYLVLDNARPHNNHKIQELWNKNRDRLELINTPAYSPQLNPQENIWNLLKNKIFNIGARKNIDELYDEIEKLYKQFNNNKALIMSVAYARNYYFNSQYMEEIST